MNDDNEKKVRRGDKLAIPANTWNNVVDATKNYKRTKYNPDTPVNGGSITDFIKSNSTVLVKNISSYDQSVSYKVMKLVDPVISPVDDMHDVNRRVAFDADVPAASIDTIAILQVPLEIDEFGKAVVAGVTVCKVKRSDSSLEWANPTPGETSYLTASSNGQAKILSWVISSDSGEAAADIGIAVVNLIGAKTSEYSRVYGRGVMSGSSVNITPDNIYVDATGCTITLPSAGTYEVKCEMHLRGQITAGLTSGTGPYIECELFDTTTGNDIAFSGYSDSSRWMGLYFQALTSVEQKTTYVTYITVSGVTTIGVRARRASGPTWFSASYQGGNGRRVELYYDKLS